MGYDARPMLIRVGQNPSTISVSRYGKHLDLLEVRLDGGAPRKRTMETMKSEAPPQLVFAVVVPKLVTALEGEATEADVAAAIEVARSLSAKWLVVRTPPSARPSARTRARLTRLVELLRPAEVSIAWEPTGLLAEAEAESLASTLGVTLARDPARDDLAPGPVAYGRIQSLGAAGRIRGSSIERAADRLSAFDEAYIILEGQNALRAAKDLRSLLAQNGASLAGGGLGSDDEQNDDEDEEELDGDGDEQDEDDEDDEDVEEEDEES